MQNTSRILNTNTVKKHIGVIALLFITQLTACAPSSGGGNAAGEGLLCKQSQNIAEQNVAAQTLSEEIDTASSEPKITVDPTVENYIVEFADQEQTMGLQPSGNAVHEFEVSGLNLKSIRSNTYSVKLSGDENLKKEMIQRLGNQRRIKYIEPDYPIQLIPQDQQEDAMTTAATAAAQWHHQTVQTANAWQVTKGSQDIVVAVIDSGIDYTHIDLKNNIWTNTKEIPNNGRDDDGNGYVDDVRGWNFVSNNSNTITTSSSNHGTHVAGIIGATGTGSRGVYGMAQKVKLMALKFIGENGMGNTSSAIRAIDYAISKRVFAINNSWGSFSKSQALDDAIKRAERAGILFIVAAGNGQNSVGFDITRTGYYPAAYTESNIIRVAATKSNDLLTGFSNFGKTLVDVAAPGYNILSTVSNGGYMNMSGTSMATPLVTGLAVLVKAANPSLTYSQVKAVIAASVDPVAALTNKIKSGGRVNARKAVAMAANVSADLAGCF